MSATLSFPVSLKVCPDGEGGTAWYYYSTDDAHGFGGSPGRSKGERGGDWTPAIRRAMRDLGLTHKGLRLSCATVVPATSPSQGVRVIWHQLSARRFVRRLESAKTEAEWHTICAECEAVNGGNYPDDWCDVVVLSGVARRAARRFRQCATVGPHR